MTKLLTNNKFYVICLGDSESNRLCLREVEVNDNLKIVSKRSFKMFVVPWAVGGIIVGFESKKDDKKWIAEKIDSLCLYDRIKRERYHS